MTEGELGAGRRAVARAPPAPRTRQIADARIDRPAVKPASQGAQAPATVRTRNRR
jgi:hypothetical protein